MHRSPTPSSRQALRRLVGAVVPMRVLVLVLVLVSGFVAYPLRVAHWQAQDAAGLASQRQALLLAQLLQAHFQPVDWSLAAVQAQYPRLQTRAPAAPAGPGVDSAAGSQAL